MYNQVISTERTTFVFIIYFLKNSSSDTDTVSYKSKSKSKNLLTIYGLHVHTCVVRTPK